MKCAECESEYFNITCVYLYNLLGWIEWMFLSPIAIFLKLVADALFDVCLQSGTNCRQRILNTKQIAFISVSTKYHDLIHHNVWTLRDCVSAPDFCSALVIMRMKPHR